MDFKHIVGLDIGTNSLGWSLIKEYWNGDIEIVKMGVHIFPIGTIVDEQNNKEKTKNEQRRMYRGASRGRYRYKMRRKNLKAALEHLGMLPDFSAYHKAKGLGQSYELYKNRANAINPAIKVPLTEIGRIFLLLNKYRGFKSNSKKLASKEKDQGVVKSGYQGLQKLIDDSGARTIGEYFYKMHEKAKALYENDKWHNFNEPIDERALNEQGEIVLFNSNGIRRHHGRYTLRDMYTNEFDLIWAAQKQHYPEIFTGSREEYDKIIALPHSDRVKALHKFKETSYWHIKEYCIYYQRPLKSQKRYVSNCQFERGEYRTEIFNTVEYGIDKTKIKRIWHKKAKKGCPKSHPLFQEFRIWQKLHQINFSSEEMDLYQQPLKREWLLCLAEVLNTQQSVYLMPTPKIKNEGLLYFGKILFDKGLLKDPNEATFFIDKIDKDVVGDDRNANKIAGNVTYAMFLEALGEDKFKELEHERVKRKHFTNKANGNCEIEVEERKLWLLWNTIYQAKDGLLKEDDWLKAVLSDKNGKWKLDETQVTKLIESGLQPDYASYSTKVLNAILPHMRLGINEYEALKAANLGYINEDNTVGAKVQLRQKISQLAYQELRNPVVERALSKSIRLVNALLEKYANEIDRETFEIRIESTRQLRKPRQEREEERRKNAEKDKLRSQYAEYLTKNKEKLGLKRDIQKYDPLVVKYELWLQMNMNEDDEVFVEQFKNFAKITRRDDILKHKLWLECGRLCPYTGDVISFTDFMNGKVDVDHIIPLSRSLDDSFNNKTLTYNYTNQEKGSMTPLEFLTKKGGKALADFKKRMHSKHNSFSDSKKKMLLAEKIEPTFSSNQITNTSYIAKYTVKKMQEVCRDVQFTNGSATSVLRSYDWGLNNLLDKIRYEEDFGVRIDDYFHQRRRIVNDFKSWYEKKYLTTDYRLADALKNDLSLYVVETKNDLPYFEAEIQKFDEFRNKSGKKDRSDHRHHAIDAFVTACSSPKIIKELSTYNAHAEQNNVKLKRDKIDRPFDYLSLYKSVSDILVSHSEKQSLIKKRKNPIKTSNGVKLGISYAPQGKLHEESFYAKRNGATVRKVLLFDDQRQEKALFTLPEDLDYTVKKEIKWNYIGDYQLYEITKRRLASLKSKAFLKEEMENKPFYRNSPKNPESTISKKGKPLPIVKSVRKRFNIDRTLISLPIKHSDGSLSTNRYSGNESNYIIAFYKNEKKRFARPVSLYDAVDNKRKNKNLIPDEIDYKGLIYGIDNEMPWLKNGDIVVLGTEDERNNIDWNNHSDLKGRLYKVKGFSTLVTPNPKYGNYEYGTVSLLNTRAVKTDKYPSQKNIEEALSLNAFTLSHDKFQATKVRINILGEVAAKGVDCF